MEYRYKSKHLLWQATPGDRGLCMLKLGAEISKDLFRLAARGLKRNG